MNMLVAVFRLDSIFAGSTNNTHKKTSANFTAKYALYKYLYLIRDKLLIKIIKWKDMEPEVYK